MKTTMMGAALGCAALSMLACSPSGGSDVGITLGDSGAPDVGPPDTGVDAGARDWASDVDDDLAALLETLCTMCPDSEGPGGCDPPFHLPAVQMDCIRAVAATYPVIVSYYECARPFIQERNTCLLEHASADCADRGLACHDAYNAADEVCPAFSGTAMEELYACYTL
jgi:hypothetical protein